MNQTQCHPVTKLESLKTEAPAALPKPGPAALAAPPAAVIAPARRRRCHAKATSDDWKFNSQDHDRNVLLAKFADRDIEADTDTVTPVRRNYCQLCLHACQWWRPCGVTVTVADDAVPEQWCISTGKLEHPPISKCCSISLTLTSRLRL